MLDSTNSDPDFMNTIITGDESWVYGYDPETKLFRNFPYSEKSDKSTKHYFTQMLLAINWRHWLEGKNSHMDMKVQGSLMEAHFIEIHQVFA